jgi:transposase
VEVIYAICAGLDVHKKTVVACLITQGDGGRPKKEIRTFGTMTDEIVKLADWLAATGCTHVAMESTGVYWQPIWNLLEGRFQLMLVNARHIKAVPGRKSDVRDCEWIANLLRHGLLKGSFVPDRQQRELRELTRFRSSLVQERTAHVNRLQKTLESANIKLAAVTSNVAGVSARQMLEALVAGSSDAAAMAQLAKGRLREKIPQLERALVGHFGGHHRYLVPQILASIDFLDERIEDLSRRIAELQRPFEDAVVRLDTIPGIGRRTAENLLAEVGPDLSRFPSAGHLASWAGMCPGSDESGGKRRSGKTRKGNPWLRAALIEAGQAAGRSSKTYLGAQFRRLAARRGKKRATVAVGHTILVIAYHLLTSPDPYNDLGPDYFLGRARDAERAIVRRLERLGYKVSPPPCAA